MRLKIALLCAALVLPFGTAKAEVVTLSNVSASGNANDTSFYIKFTTAGTGAFQLGTFKTFGGAASDVVSYSLKNSTGSVINNITGSSVSMSTNILTFSSNTFGEGTYWLEILNLTSHGKGAAGALLTGDAFGVSAASEVTGVGLTTLAADIDVYQVELTVNVPEPATMILTGSALAAGAIGAYFKRRRKPQTEIVA